MAFATIRKPEPCIEFPETQGRGGLETLLGHLRQVVQRGSGLKARLRTLWQEVFPTLRLGGGWLGTLGGEHPHRWGHDYQSDTLNDAC